jgi:hypothetical protein
VVPAPQLRRVAVAAARALLRLALRGDRVEFVLAIEDADPVARLRWGRPCSRRGPLSGEGEFAAYHAARYLLRLADVVLEQADRQTLDLEGQREQVRAADGEVERECSYS